MKHLQSRKWLRWRSSSYHLQDRVPSVQGDAFDLKEMVPKLEEQEATMRHIDEPTHVKVEAIDEFQALMPWSQLDLALVSICAGRTTARERESDSSICP